MPTWAIPRFATFNLTVLVVGVIFVVCLYRKRTPGVAISGVVFSLVISVLMMVFSQQPIFFLITLACSILFLHLPLWLATSAWFLWREHRWFSVVSIVLTLALEAVAYDAFFFEPTALVVTRYEMTDARIERPMRIVVIADFQTDQIEEYERYTLEAALREQPDLILFAGDYFAANYFTDWPEIRDKCKKLFTELDFDAPLGVYAVQGNLDRWLPWPVVFDGMKGKRVTGPTTRSFVVGAKEGSLQEASGGIRLTCLADLDSFNPHLRLADHRDGRFHIVLGHSPDYALGSIDADILLAGHTHGGQICLPFLGPLSTGCNVPRAWSSGLTELPKLADSDRDRHTPRRLIVSRGTGMERGPAPRIRFLCRPELIVIDLVPGKP